MRRIAVLSLFLCLVAVCRAQYIGSQYMNVKLGYIVDESQVQGTFGFGKVYKAFKVGANLNYRNLNRDLVKANTVTVGPELAYYALKGRKFSLLGIAAGTIGYQKAKAKSDLVYLAKSKAFVYGYEVGIRPEMLLSPKVALFAEYRFEMLFNSILRNNNMVMFVGCSMDSVCMALCFVGCSKDDDEPGGKGAMYEVTIEQSGDFRSFIKSVVVVANGTRLKDGATGESLASPLILSDEELAVEKVTLTTTGKAIEFAVSGSVVDGEDGVVNEPMQWVVTVYKNGKEIEKKSLSFRDGKGDWHG